MKPVKKRRRSSPIAVRRLPITFSSDVRRVITRFFDPGGEARIQNIVQRVAGLSDSEVAPLLELILERFSGRHGNIVAVFEQHYRCVASMVSSPDDLDRDRRLLIGSYFTMEYSIESAALFNPSIVAHPNQSGVPDRALRFIMSLRATGEGHVSSIVFRTGVINSGQEIEMDPPSSFAHPIGVFPDNQYDKRLFQRKLDDVGADKETTAQVLKALGGSFTMAELEQSITVAREAASRTRLSEEALQSIRWLARSNYQLQLSSDAEVSEMVIFPQTSNESRGIEDLRMVRFVDDDEAVIYYGTCTAFDGYRILPQLIETTDFLRIGVHTLNGSRAQNKGMALFPRRIGGDYVMCSRIDGENLYIMRSDVVYFWETSELLQMPRKPWEFVQIGNCGSPVETPAGWLVLTHGVGPMRTYCIGAMLLDLEDPARVIGVLDEPLIVPEDEERDGYVPNVAYTCGAMIHKDVVYVPFATSDTRARFATVPLDQLLDRLR